MFIYNNEKYNPDKYAEETTSQEAVKDIQNVNFRSSQVQRFQLSQKRINSAEHLLLPGFGGVEKVYYELERTDSMPAGSRDIVMSLEFEMNTDQISHMRSCYTFLDFLGDVGGLFDMLRIVGECLMGSITLLAGSGLDRFIIANVFKFQGNAERR